MLEVEIEGLPEALDGLRIAHLSDFHLGVPLPRAGRDRARRRLGGERQPDLVCITGDLVSHPRGVPLLVQLLRTLERPFVVLGNHDVAVTRDPFSRAAELDGLAEVATLLRDEATIVERRRATDPARRRRRRRATRAATARPVGARRPRRRSPHPALPLPGHRPRLPAGAFDLVLAGHLHAGQIVLPYPGGQVDARASAARGSSRGSTGRRAA